MCVGKNDFFRFLLMNRLQELQKAADKTFQDLRKDERDFPDPLDRAVKELARSVELEMRNYERLLIREIHSALQRLDQGDFGICETCGKTIAKKRLQANPTTRFCVLCQTTEESAKRSMPYVVEKQQMGSVVS